MANGAHGLSHAKWMCKRHIALTPKHRRKVICNQCRGSLGEIFRRLCSYGGAEIIEGHPMPGHVHVPASMPPKVSVPGFMGHLEGKSALMMLDGHAGLKCKFGNRHFWSEGCHVAAVGLNEAAVAKYIRDQEARGIATDKLGVKEHEDPFKQGWASENPLRGQPGNTKAASGGCGESRAIRLEQGEGQAPRDAAGAPWPHGPRANHPFEGWSMILSACLSRRKVCDGSDAMCIPSRKPGELYGARAPLPLSRIRFSALPAWRRFFLYTKGHDSKPE